MLLVPSLKKGARVLPIVLTAHPGVAGLCLLTLVEYFAKSLTVIENGTIRNFGYDFLFAFRSKYNGRICSRYDTIHERDRHQTDTA